MPEALAARAKEPRDLVTGGAIVLFFGIGLGAFLSLTHTWFDGVKFYDVSPSVVAIVLGVVGASALTVGISTPQSPARTHLTALRRIAFALALLIWVGLGSLYRLTPDFDALSRQHALTTAYRGDAVCSSDIVRDMALRTAVTGPQPRSSSICTVAWTKVTEKVNWGGCLQLNGAVINGPFCWGVRYQPYCFRHVAVGDALVAQTAYGRPSAYYCPSNDPAEFLISGRGEVIQIEGNPVREFELMFINRLLLLGAYLVIGFVIAFRLSFSRMGAA